MPEAGGVLDQDATLWERMQVLSSVHRVVQRYARAKGEEIHNLTPSERRVIRSLIDEELW